MSSSNKSFMDSNTIIAIVLVGITWLGWQYYQMKKYPDYYKQKQEQQLSKKTKGESAPKGEIAKGVIEGGESEEVITEKKDEIAEKLPKKEMLVPFNDEFLSFSVSSKGMGLKNIELKKYKDREFKPLTIGLNEGNLPFETNLVGRRRALDFVVEKTHENQFYGKAKVGSLVVHKIIVVDSKNYSINVKVDITNAGEDFSGLVNYISNGVKKKKSGGGFLPQFDNQEFYFSFDGTDTERVTFSDEDVQKNFAKVNVASVGSQYFALAILDQSGIMPNASAVVRTEIDAAFAQLTYNVLKNDSNFTIKYLGFLGPKSYNILSRLDDRLSHIINFGWFNFIATYILKLMKIFYQYIGNWGLAIILLTIIVRLVVLPFNVMSYKSMKKMQIIQPEIKKLREKYKDDRQKLNQEMMVLMREAKANPLGGCLPMLIQFPVFIALYQVLGQSVELYQAPFGLWIGDLSLKDPFYVLPILMGTTMFIQQKITPSTMDPAQAKVMAFLPLFFAILMASLPSGLTLYIFISTLFGIIQQYIFMKPQVKQA